MEQFAVRVGWIYLVHDDKLIVDGLITWADKSILYVGAYNPSEIERGMTVFNYPKAILTPPFINGHTHIPETLIRGLVDDEPLETWLYDHVWKVEPMMTKEDAKIGTQLGIAEMVSTGTVGFVDQFYYSNEICEVVEDMGVKAYIFPSIFDNNPESGAIENSFKVAQSTFKKWNNYDQRIKVGYGPHALYSVDLELFQRISSKAREQNTLIHTHVQETKTELKNAVDQWGKSTIKQFEEMGVLDVIIAAHVVHSDNDDIKLMKEYNTTVLHNIQSNMKLASGLAPVPEYIKNGINVMVGTDGSASNNNLDMLEELRTVSLIHKGINHNPRILPISEIMRMGTINANKLFKNFYSGKLEAGEPCDFTIFSLNGFSSSPLIRPLSNLLFSVSSSNCTMTVCNGKILYKDGNLPNIDTERLLEKAQSVTDNMIKKADYEI